MRIFTIIMGVLLSIGGVYCMLQPGATFMTIGWLIGVMFLISGVNMLAAYMKQRGQQNASGGDLLSAILVLLLGLLLVVNDFAQFMTDTFILYLVGITIIITGVARIYTSLNLRKLGIGAWIWAMVVGVFTLVMGIYLLIHPMVTAMALGLLIGFVFIQQGITLLGIGLAMPND